MAHSKALTYLVSRVYVDTEEFKVIRETTTHVQIAPGFLRLSPTDAQKVLPDLDLTYPGDVWHNQEVEIVLWSKRSD